MLPIRTLLYAITTGGVVGAAVICGVGVARAAPMSVAAYVQTDGPLVCQVLAQYPSLPGVSGIVDALLDEGFTPTETGDIMVEAVSTYCPNFSGLIVSWAQTRVAAAGGGQIV